MAATQERKKINVNVNICFQHKLQLFRVYVPWRLPSVLEGSNTTVKCAPDPSTFYVPLLFHIIYIYGVFLIINLYFFGFKTFSRFAI